MKSVGSSHEKGSARNMFFTFESIARRSTKPSIVSTSLDIDLAFASNIMTEAII